MKAIYPAPLQSEALNNSRNVGQKSLQCLLRSSFGSFTITTRHHSSRIPDSLTITRYLHDYIKQTSVQLVGPLYAGKELFSDPVIFVDGGAQFRHTDEGLAVGDGDSHLGKLDEKLNREKDYSDLSYVLFSLPAHFNEVFLHGFMGGQRDHEWANLGEINAFLTQRHQATQLHLGSDITGFTAGQWQLEIDEPFSLLCLTRSKITLVGQCDYQLKQKTRLEPLCSHGISNLGRGPISLQSDEPIFIVYPKRKNDPDSVD